MTARRRPVARLSWLANIWDIHRFPTSSRKRNTKPVAVVRMPYTWEFQHMYPYTCSIASRPAEFGAAVPRSSKTYGHCNTQYNLINLGWADIPRGFRFTHSPHALGCPTQKEIVGFPIDDIWIPMFNDRVRITWQRLTVMIGNGVAVNGRNP